MSSSLDSSTCSTGARGAFSLSLVWPALPLALPPLRGPSAPQHFLFMGLTHQLEQSYRYQGGIIQAGAGYDPGEGAVVVAIAFGHTDRVTAVEQAFQSLSSLQQVPPG